MGEGQRHRAEGGHEPRAKPPPTEPLSIGQPGGRGRAWGQRDGPQTGGRRTREPGGWGLVREGLGEEVKLRMKEQRRVREQERHQKGRRQGV